MAKYTRDQKVAHIEAATELYEALLTSARIMATTRQVLIEMGGSEMPTMNAAIVEAEAALAKARELAPQLDPYDVLEEAREWFYDREDIDDEGGPNDAMRLKVQIDAVLAKAGRS